MAVVSFQPAVVVYREEQNFDWWVYALVAGADAIYWGVVLLALRAGPNAAPGPGPGALGLALLVVAGVVFPALLFIGLLRMTTEVSPAGARVWFGWVPTYRRRIPFGSIQRIEVVTYRPLAEYGGWGIRIGRDGVRAFSARGNRGVRLDLADGTRLLIGSQRPEELALALEQTAHPGA